MFITDQYDQVIILEVFTQATPHPQDDLEIAPDFFEYFDATSPLLWTDSSLFCVSAWNDNGQANHVSDAGTSSSSSSRQSVSIVATSSPAWVGCSHARSGRSWVPAGRRRTGTTGCAILTDDRAARASDLRWV